MKGHFFSPYFWLDAIVAVVLVFALCALIDWVRIQTIEKATFRYIDRWLDRQAARR